MKTTRYIPQGFVQFVPNLTDFYTNPNPLFECWVSREKPVAIFYAGKSSKPLFYTQFMTEESMKKKIVSTISNLMDWEDKKAERREARKAPHTLKIGDILYTSWGYEQTNVDFFQVVDLPSKCFAELRKIKSELIPSEGLSPMAGKVVGLKDKFCEYSDYDRNVSIKRKVSSSNTVHISGCQTAWLWDGNAKYCSWYA